MRSPTNYEKFVKQAIEEISAGGTVVHHRDMLLGKRSGRSIVVDLSFEITVGGDAQVLIVVECKRYRDKVRVDDVEEFRSKLDDIGAHKGIMVTTVGYQNGAVKFARAVGIALATLTDEPQLGEIVYVVDSIEPPPRAYCSDKLLQGNLRPWGPVLGAELEGGLRFESFQELWSVLYLGLDSE